MTVKSKKIENQPDYIKNYEGKKDANLNKVSTYKNLKSMVTPGGNTLDIGCGTGYLIDFLGGGVGVDINPKLIKEAEKGYPRNKFIVSSCYEIPLEGGKFDTIVMCMILEHLDNPEKALNEAKRLLKKGGKLIIVVPRKNDPFYRFCVRKDPTHVIEYNTKELRGLVSKVLNVQEIRYGSVSTKIPSWATFLIKPDIILSCKKTS